jgi:tetratricopeptide (TPR) repeat protein
LIILSACQGIEKEEYVQIKDSYHNASFEGSASCIECHKEEYDLWTNSHHDLAMKIADSTTIRGDFNNTTFTHKGVKSTFFKKDGDYYVNTQGKDGSYSDYKIIYTFGVTPLQQYIVKFPDGVYNCLLTAWDELENKWFHLQPDLDLELDEWLNWTNGGQRWNTMCADCHSTDLRKNYDNDSKVFNTTFSEINVACEACHGPSSEHVAFYNNQEENEEKGGLPPEMYMGGTADSKELVDKCARCHSRRGSLTPYFDYVGSFMDHYRPTILEEPLYELDGQIRDEVYVYASFLQSQMYQEGVSCMDCHNAHSLQLKRKGNDLCMSCHTPNYNSSEHHYHEMNTDAALCINCHMDGKLYMVNDYRRDHSFRIPRPDQSVKYNTPNACNKCHTDKSAEWASNFIIENYGPERADHFSDHLLKGYFEDPNEFKIVYENKKYPEIARATAINNHINSQISYDDVLALTKFLNDSSVLVRREAISAMEIVGNKDLSSFVKPLLKDSLRLVRISAARYFYMTDKSEVELLPEFGLANKEYMTELKTNADLPAGLHQLAVYEQSVGNTDKALEYYQEAIIEDSYNNYSRMNLALLYYEKGLYDESEKTYLKIIEQQPDNSSSYYLLGLLYNELNKKDKALTYLTMACEREPANVNAFYNLALLLQQNNRTQESLKVISKGLNIFPMNERLLYIRLIGEVNLNLSGDALATCNLLLQLSPDNQNYLQIRQRLMRR